ncbi:MAG TPA: alpha/beta hydrolase-fold protein, partial [Phycisphaerae bacterium]
MTTEDLGGDQFRVTFTYTAPAGTKTVNLAGSFNGWSTTATPMPGPDEKGRFAVELVLPKGRHEYKFVRDGSAWEPDPDATETVPPHSNAVLRLGVTARDEARTSPMDMAHRAEHPEDFLAVVAQNSPCADRGRVRDLVAPGALPWVREQTVSFLMDDPNAEDPYIVIEGHGFRTGYVMDRLRGKEGFFALTLRRSDLPADSVYTIEFEKDGRTQHIVDPLAWTATSRNGKPVSVIAAPDLKKGRIVLIPPVSASGPAIAARELYVYLPAGYDAKRADGYPVAYMHDGQNLWDDPTEPFGHGGWQVNVMADRLINEGKVRPFIVVGIPNSPERMKEYAPGRSIFDDSDHPYLQYIVRDVKPL